MVEKIKEKPKNSETVVSRKRLWQAIGIFLLLMLLINFFLPIRPTLFLREGPAFPYDILGLIIDGMNPASNLDYFTNPLVWLFFFVSPLFIVIGLIYVVNNLLARKVLGGVGTIQHLFIKTSFYAVIIYGILGTVSYWAYELTLKSGYTIGSISQDAYQNYVHLSFAMYTLVWIIGSFGLSRYIIRNYQLQNRNFLVLFLTNLSLFFLYLLSAYLVAFLVTGISSGRY